MISSYSSLPISTYDKIVGVINSGKSDAEKDVALISILLNKPESHVLSLDLSEFQVLLTKLEFLRSKPSVTLPKSLKYNGVEYSLDFSKLTLGQFMDWSRDGLTFTQMLHVILVPVGHEYNDGYDVDFGKLPTDISLSVVQSFLKGLSSRSRRSLISLEVLLRLTRHRAQARSVRSMDSFTLPIQLVV